MRLPLARLLIALALLTAGAPALSACGSEERRGADLEQLEQEGEEAVEGAGDAVEQGGDAVEQGGDEAAGGEQ